MNPEAAGRAITLHVGESGCIDLAGCFGVAGGAGVGAVSMSPAVLTRSGLIRTSVSTTILRETIVVAIVAAMTTSGVVGAMISSGAGVAH